MDDVPRDQRGSVLDPAFLLSLPPLLSTHRYSKRDTILYALSAGAGQDPADEAELPFVFEDGLLALPTMAVVLAYPGFWQMEPHFGIDWRQVLHAEQSCDFHAALPVEGEVRGELSIDAIVDKGPSKGALLRAQRLVYDQSDDRLLATVRQTSYLRGDGGRGEGGVPIPPLVTVPRRAPDQTIALQTRAEQALLYRLSGDYNPLHAHPEVARSAGFARPILHGLCVYAFAGRAILASVCDHDPKRLRRLECRFTAPVYPGEPLEVRVWQETGEDVSFQVVALHRELIVIDRGRAVIAGN